MSRSRYVSFFLKKITRRLHSSRMRTARTLTVSRSMLCTGERGVLSPGGWAYLVLGVGVLSPGGCT